MTTVLNAYTLSECMEIMSDYAAAFEKSGGRNVIFCEDRLTLLAERALLARMGGTFRSSVATFARYLKTDAKVLTKQGSVMAVGGIMEELQRKQALRCFTSPAGIAANAKCVYETSAQLAASRVSADDLRDSLALLPEDALKNKVSDLAEIYGEYTDFLRRGGYVDESGYLALLPDCIRADQSLRGAHVFFLAYSSFTAQAAEAIRAAREVAADVVGIFCSGSEEIYTGRAPAAFCRALEEYGKVRILNVGKPLAGEAEVLRKGLFDPESLGTEKMKTDKIHIFEAEDKPAEAEYIAAVVKKLLSEENSLRYRDIALLLPDVKSYSLAVKKAFDEYGIPFFIDEKRSLKGHPLSLFLLDCFAAVRDGYSPETVQSLTGNVFFGDSDEYRNYLLKFCNYRGGAKREIKSGDAVKDYDREKLCACRERLLTAVKNIGRKGQGRDYCNAARKILADFDAENVLKKLEGEVGDVAFSGYLSQILPALNRTLDEAELLTSSRTMTAGEFETILSDGLSATEISLIPMKADAVFVGDITDSRIEKVRILFAAGMTEEVPRSADDTALVSDKEIEKLAMVKTMIEPTVAEVNLRSRESVSLNLCAFTDSLYLSYALAADGSEPALSEIFRYVDGLFCDNGKRKIVAEKKLPDSDFQYICSAPLPAVRRLLIKKNNYERCKEDTRREYSSLYTALLRLGVISERDEYFSECGGQMRIRRGEELFFKDGKVSPTALEGYFRCPFGNFGEQGLKLKEREESTVMAVDSGNFIHSLLEKTTEELGRFATENEARAYASAVGRKLLQNPLFAAQADTAAGAYSSERLLSEGTEVAAAVFRQLKGSAYRVAETEKSVDTEVFRGKIDRVDVCDCGEEYVRVVDYKTGKIDDSPVSYYTGRRLQLQLYMSAVKGDRVPAGVFYFPASVSYTLESDGKFRMKGFLNGAQSALLAGDKNLAAGKKSEFFDADLSENVRLDKVMDEQTFRYFLDYGVFEARQGAAELKGGFIAPSPYKGECEYCRYGGMCGFNMDIAPERSETAIKSKTIAEIARRYAEGGEKSGEDNNMEGTGSTEKTEKDATDAKSTKEAKDGEARHE